MMLLPIYINNQTIGAIYARRLEDLSQGRKTYHYDWEVTLEATAHRDFFRAAGSSLPHVRSDGSLVLVAKILQAAGVQI